MGYSLGFQFGTFVLQESSKVNLISVLVLEKFHCKMSSVCDTCREMRNMCENEMMDTTDQSLDDTT